MTSFAIQLRIHRDISILKWVYNKHLDIIAPAFIKTCLVTKTVYILLYTLFEYLKILII